MSFLENNFNEVAFSCPKLSSNGTGQVSGVFFKFHLIVGVEESIVNALYGLRITDQLFKSDVLHEWCVHIDSSTPTTR
jgi:hypothetical protein